MTTKLEETRRRDRNGNLVKEARGPNGERALAMCPNHGGRCAGCGDSYPITVRDYCFVVNDGAGWKLYHLGEKCRPAWIRL